MSDLITMVDGTKTTWKSSRFGHGTVVSHVPDFESLSAWTSTTLKRIQNTVMTIARVDEDKLKFSSASSHAFNGVISEVYVVPKSISGFQESRFMGEIVFQLDEDTVDEITAFGVTFGELAEGSTPSRIYPEHALVYRAYDGAFMLQTENPSAGVDDVEVYYQTSGCPASCFKTTFGAFELGEPVKLTFNVYFSIGDDMLVRCNMYINGVLVHKEDIVKRLTSSAFNKDWGFRVFAGGDLMDTPIYLKEIAVKVI